MESHRGKHRPRQIQERDAVEVLGEPVIIWALLLPRRRPSLHCELENDSGTAERAAYVTTGLSLTLKL